MNHIFRNIWNPSTGTCVATNEHASAHRGTASSSSVLGAVPSATALAAGVSVGAWRLLPLAVMLAWGGLAVATPQGGTVSAGSASITQGAGQMTITQTTPHVAINWQSFGIGAGQSVQFVQPGRSSVALNRVTGADPSAILGRLSANGQVFLVNPNGIFFGSGASVDVGGLVASTLNISDADFMAGRYRFTGAAATELLNQGALQASSGGYVALLGAQVINQGTVLAPRGSVAMVAGQDMTLDLLGHQLLSVRVDQGVANAFLSNGGLLQADGGQVLMSTQAAGNVLANAVNNTGVVQAQTVENRQGTIVLLGSMDTGTVSLGGTLDVSAGPGQRAGQVLVSGHQVGLFDAHIQASGGAGGGQVLIGGGYQGRDLAVLHAQAVYMSTGATIEANTRDQGDGGQVVLWANGSTRAQGQLSARGGAQGGAGGLIETSGQWLDVAGLRVDTRAPLGKIGTWLLDPADITVSSAATTDATATGGVFAPNSGVNAANINATDLVTALGGSNVTVSTTNTGVSGAGLGNIDVNAVVTWTAPTTLTLDAAGNVNVNNAITGTDGSLAVTAGGNVTVGAAVKTTTGQLSFTAAQDVNINAATTITTGNLQAVAGRNVTVSAASTITAGNMVLRSDNDGTGPGAAAGTVAITCGSNCLTITTGQLSIRFNPVNYASTSSEVLAYDANLTGAGTLDAKAWVFGKGDNKAYDGTTTATVSGLLPDTSGVAPPVTLGAVSNASFADPEVGADKPISFDSSFADAAYALFAPVGLAAGSYSSNADITAQALTISELNAVKVYGEIFASTGFTTSGLVNGETVGGVTLTSSGQDPTASVVGSPYAIVPSNATGGTFNPSNYSISYVNGALTVTPAPLTITAQNVSKVYGQTQVLSGFDASALVNGETVGGVTLTSSGQDPTASVVGSPYVIVPSNATGGTFTPSNYSISYVNGVLTVTPAPLTITAQDVSKVYGQTAVLNGFDVSALVNGETVGSVTLASTGQAPTAGVAGSPYAIVPSNATGGTFTPSNYSISYVNGVLTVTPAPLTITAQDVSKVYGQTAVLNGFDVSALANDESVNFVSMSSEGRSELSSEESSPYAIVPSDARGGSFTPANYSISYVSGVLTVTPITPPAGVPEVQPVPPTTPVVPNTEVPSANLDTQALPHVPIRDVRPAPLIVLPLADVVQEPVTAAIVLTPTPAPTPSRDAVPELISTTLADPKPPGVQVPPPTPEPMPIRRPFKQDRN